MEKHKTCAFFGHRKIDVTEELKLNLLQTIDKLITEHQVVNFLFGSRSEFDSLCHLTVTQLKEKYPFLKRIAYTCKSETCTLESQREKWEKIYSSVLNKEIILLGVEEEYEHKTKYTAGKASYIERNRAMINNSDFCIFYYDKNYQLEKLYNKSKSGTALSFVYAKQKKKSIINLFKT